MPKTKTTTKEDLKTIALATISFIGLFGHSIGNNIPYWEKSTRHPNAIYADAHCLPARRQYMPLDNVSAWDKPMAELAHNECIYKRVQETIEKYPEYVYWQRYYKVYDPISKTTSRVAAHRR